jgi:hypothetical protein
VLTQEHPSCAGRRMSSRRHPAVGQAAANPQAANPPATRSGSAPRLGNGQAAIGHERASRGKGRTAVPGDAPMSWRMLRLTLSPGVAGAFTAGCLHPLIGEILAAAMVIVPLATGVTLVAVIAFGSIESSNRIFRLLRWIHDGEEPSPPSR